MASRGGKKNTPTQKKKRILHLLPVVLLAVAFVFCAASIFKLLWSQSVYQGVYLENIPLGGMNREEVTETITQVYDLSDVFDITLTAEDQTALVNTAALSPSPDYEQITEAAFSYGRQKKGLARLGEIRNLRKAPAHIPFSLSLNEYELQSAQNKLADKLNIRASDNRIEIGEDSVTIHKGVAGKGMLFEEVKNAVSQCILNKQNICELTLREIIPEEISESWIHRNLQDTPQDSTYSIVNHRMVYTASYPGVKIKDGDIRRILKENKNASSITIPAVVTQPQHTPESLTAQLLGDELGKFSSDYSSSSNDRAHNILLACNKIDGYILAPGEVFSYNDTVGPRTTERGFRMANVYVGNTVQPGVGGGICQVSSTMYNAVVYADLNVTQRRNHTLPVSYVPIGRDATVAYGSIDFQFENNLSGPICIRTICDNGQLTVKILGKQEHPQRTIKIETEKTGTTPPKVVKKTDPELPQGQKKIESAGTSGSSYAAYKIVYENGAEISREKLCSSTYAGKDRVEITGTKPVPTATPKPSAASTPAPTSTPKSTQSASPSETVPTAQAEMVE